jgi:hypothetical protein
MKLEAHPVGPPYRFNIFRPSVNSVSSNFVPVFFLLSDLYSPLDFLLQASQFGQMRLEGSVGFGTYRRLSFEKSRSSGRRS